MSSGSAPPRLSDRWRVSFSRPQGTLSNMNNPDEERTPDEPHDLDDNDESVGSAEPRGLVTVEGVAARDTVERATGQEDSAPDVSDDD